MYVINLDDKQSEGTHWISLFIDKNTVVCFYSLGIEYISQKVLSTSINNFIIHNIFRIQSANSIICGCYCIAYIVKENVSLDFRLKNRLNKKLSFGRCKT